MVSPAQNIMPRISMDVKLCYHPALPGGPFKLPGRGRLLGFYPHPRAFREACMYPPFPV